MTYSLNKPRLLERCCELTELLRAVNRGWVVVTDITNGYLWPCFHLSTGHKIVVFNDAGEWDYIEGIYCPDGLWIDLYGKDTDDVDILDDTSIINELRHHNHSDKWDWDKALNLQGCGQSPHEMMGRK